MRKTTTTRYDVAEHLRTPEDIRAYLEACFEEAKGDAAFIAKALGNIARAQGMAQVARDAGLSRESLYKALSGERSPGFDTISKGDRSAGVEAACPSSQGPWAAALACSFGGTCGKAASSVRQTQEEQRGLISQRLYLSERLLADSARRVGASADEEQVPPASP